MSEKTIQEGLQVIFRSMTQFADADVVINDWSILDASMEAAPYILISNSDDPTFDRPTVKADTTWNIRILLFQRFLDWETTYNGFRDNRQAMIDKMNEVGTTRSAGGISGVDIRSVRTATPIIPWFDPMIAPENVIMADPTFIFQEFIFETKEVEQ